ncbi:helix-turn-helix transcriptional regulator [Paenarthrobacter sp. RAF9]
MSNEQRRELGLFLRTRRTQALRSDYGLPPVGRSRERGLRREEIAFLSGVSVTWYTWLEQGRDISPSRQVLESIARALHLSDTGLGYVLSLGGYSSAPPKGPVAAGKRFLAEFRAETGQRLGDPDVAYQVERLKEASPDFQESWDRYDILGFQSRERLFHHPAVGVLQMEHHQVSPSDRPDLHIVVYTPAPGSDAGEQMERLMGKGKQIAL